jgi:integrase
MIMSELFDLFQKTYGHEVTPRVRRDYKNMFLILDDAFGHREVTAVRPRHVAEFINEPDVGKVHRNRMVMLLNMVFLRAMGSWCIDFDLVNPCIPVRRHPTKPRTRYVTDEEFAAFRVTVPATVQVAMDLAVIIGQRQSDITQMKWDQVHMEGPRETWEIWIDQGKTGKRLAIGITPAVEAVLARAKLLEPQLPRVYVIRNQFGRAYTPDGFRALWQSYMRPWRKAHPGVTGWTFHDLRAKCVSDNKSLAAASLLAGHRNQTITGSVYDRNRRRVEPLR